MPIARLSTVHASQWTSLNGLGRGVYGEVQVEQVWAHLWGGGRAGALYEEVRQD